VLSAAADGGSIPGYLQRRRSGRWSRVQSASPIMPARRPRRKAPAKSGGIVFSG